MNIETGKVPPQAIELEEAILGALMIESDTYATIANLIDTPSFYKEAHQIIFSVIKTLATSKKPVDLFTVTEELRSKDQIGKAGGVIYLTQLTSKVVSAANVEHHARIVAQKFSQREMIRVASEIYDLAYDSSIDIVELFTFSDSAINKVINNISVEGGTSNQAVISQTCKEIEADCINAAKGELIGIPTGFRTLDSIIGGWRPGTLSIMASRPGIGKTSLALHFAKVAGQHGKWVNFFSMEMSKSDLVKIMISGESGVQRNRIRDGRLDVNDWNQINKSLGKLEKLPIIWNDRAGINVNQIKASIRKNIKAGKCDLVIIDYLQLIAPTEKKVIREQQISEISRVLKEITLNESIPIICLSQLNREAEHEEPRPSHLRESGAIEQDADIILFPWRPGYNGDTSNGETIPEDQIKMIIGKNRRGCRGNFKIVANAEMTSFKEHTGESDFPAGDPDKRIENSKDLPF